MLLRRVFLVIMDACGVGELPDAAAYGDVGAATLPNLAKAVGGLDMPNCRKLGLGQVVSIRGVTADASDRPETTGCFGKMAEQSPGKDSTSGHWEISGIILKEPFPVFPGGFPRDLVRAFEKKTGVTTIGNIAASGTEIIRDLGEEHLKTGSLILYTSADSVFQLAAHEELVPPERLHEICRQARELLRDEYAVGRVIARPFIGRPGSFERTAGRRDFSLPPPGDTILDLVKAAGLGVLGIGKVYDLFAERGFTSRIRTADNDQVMESLIRAAQDDHKHDLVFANCVDFDMLWGHRNDEKGFARGLERFDQQLGRLMDALRDDDLLLLTADHGCDPTIKASTDHTREYVPLMVYGRRVRTGVNLGTRETFADIACTMAETFAVRHSFPGRSFLRDIISTR